VALKLKSREKRQRTRWLLVNRSRRMFVEEWNEDQFLESIY
jgi:hypothetical protein